MVKCDVCFRDGSLVNILPLSTVVQEICKQGPAPPAPSVNSFEDFYNRVDQDEFNKIHFTDNRAQFYRVGMQVYDLYTHFLFLLLLEHFRTITLKIKVLNYWSIII